MKNNFKAKIISVLSILIVISSLIYFNVRAADEGSDMSNSSLVDYISCSSLGMTANNENKAITNYKILLDALKSGKKILVDNIYYLDSIYYSNEEGNLISSNVFIKGTDKETNKLIIFDGMYFNVQGDVTIDGISIEGKSTKGPGYLLELTAPFRLSAHINNNYISGNIRLLSTRIPDDFNYESTDCGINDLEIANNEIYDIYNSSGNRSIIYVQNTPVKTTHIINNKITNFSYIFYDAQITDDHPYERYLAAKNEKVYIENNIVKCTDDYSAINKNGGEISFYYSFAVIEGLSVDCKGNTFEGIHLVNSPGTLVYDNYLSVAYLNYENNIWKNNVNLTPGISNVDIMKSKSNKGYSDATRVYRGNHYITEASYADKFGQDRYLLRKKMDTFQEWMKDVTIEDNTFDMYILTDLCYKMAVNYKFNNNIMNLTTMETNAGDQAFIGIIEYRDSTGSLVPRQFSFVNNTVNIGTAASDKAIGTNKMYQIVIESTTLENVKVDFTNNNIKVYGLTGIIEDGRYYNTIKANPLSKYINYNNNIVSNNNSLIGFNGF